MQVVDAVWSESTMSDQKDLKTFQLTKRVTTFFVIGA